MKKALVYFQSGGPTSVINTSLYGVIVEAKKHEEIGGIYGSLNGIEGLLYDNLIDLRAEDEAQIELLKQTPGTILGTTRHKLPKDLNDEQYQKILATLKKHNVGYLLVNGGNDSMDTCHKLSVLLKKVNYDCNVIGIPKTIDNDLAFTDHCLGFPSAAKYVVQSIQDITLDNRCYSKGKVAVIEVMGRNAGWLTAAAATLGDIRPDKIYLPEEAFDLEKFCADVKEIYDRKKNAVIVVSEGVPVHFPNREVTFDGFGHAQLGGIAYALADEIKRRYGFPTRPIEFSLMQRAGASHITLVDQKEAIKVSSVAVKKVIAGKTNSMVVILRKPGKGYKVSYALKNLSRIANVEHKLTPELIADIHGEGKLMSEYLLPLIEGQPKQVFENGRLSYTKLKKVRVQ